MKCDILTAMQTHVTFYAFYMCTCMYTGNFNLSLCSMNIETQQQAVENNSCNAVMNARPFPSLRNKKMLQLLCSDQ